MSTYIFTGKVLPERTNVEVSKIVFPLEHEKIKGTATVSISYSQISVSLEVKTTLDLFTLKNTVESMVRMIVDTYGYITGRGYDVEITSVLDDDFNQTIFGIGIPALEEKMKERPIPDMNILLPSVASSIQLQYALHNLREAVRTPQDTDFFCYRAIENIRQTFKLSSDKGEEESWERIKKDLKIKRGFIETIAKSENQRHGEASDVSEKERINSMNCAWKVVDRYCLFLKDKQLLKDLEELQ